MARLTPLASSGGERGLGSAFRGRRAARWVFGGASRLALAVALFAGIFLPSPAAASDEAESPIDDLDCEPTAAELEDIGFIAEQDGIDMEEAIARLGWQSCFSEAVDYLQATYPETYAGAAIVDRGRGAWIAFTGQVPDEAVELAAAIPVAVRLIDDRTVSQAELNETLQAVHAAVSQHEEIVAAGGSYDLETGKVMIQAQPRETLSEEKRERLLETIQPAQPTDPAIAIEVVLVDELVGGADEEAANPSRHVAQTVGSAALLAGAATVLVVSLLRKRQRRRAVGSPDTKAGRTG
jgi:hypothetical protein